MTPENQIAWWGTWCASADERLRRPERPFGPVRLGGTLSAFALGNARATPDLDAAKAFVTALVHSQTDQVRSIDYRPEVNCADLANGRIVLDSEVIASSRFRPGATATERLDILGGLALHEAAHHQFSSPELCARARSRGELFFRLFNLLDDEFIEMRLAQASPGFGDYLRATRQYMFGDACARLVRHDPTLLGVLVLFVRYPRALSWRAVAPWIHELERIRGNLTPFPRTEEDVYRAAEDMYDCLAGANGPLSSPALTRLLDQLADHQLVPASGDRRARRLSPGRSRPGGEEGRRQMRVSLPSLVDSHARADWVVTWERPSGDRDQYERDAKAVLPHVVRLRRAIARTRAQKDTMSRGRRSGQLDRRKLHALAFRHPYVFLRKEERASGLTIALLVDESGSMDGPKIEAARRVAILFREALASVPEVELFIYGHSADDPSGATNIFTYWAPRQRMRRYSLGAIQPRGNNRDGVAIGAVARELLRQARHRHIVLVVVSDGAPHADRYNGAAAVEHTRRVVRTLRSIHVVHVGIDREAGSKNICKPAFSFTNLGQLVGQMSRLLEGLLSHV